MTNNQSRPQLNRLPFSRVSDLIKLSLFLTVGLSTVPAQADGVALKPPPMAIIQKYCLDCHGSEGSVTTTSFPDGLALESALKSSKSLELWQKIKTRITDKNRPMPPDGMPAPTASEVDQLVSWVNAATPAKPPVQSLGRALHRLNRREYANSVRDLFGLDLQAERDLPEDELGCGFDNNANILSIIPPGALEQYLTAAQKAVKRALRETRSKLISCDPAATGASICARQILLPFAERAWRRPLQTTELQTITSGAEKHSGVDKISFENGIELALTAILTSPNFLYRVQRGVGALDDYSIASELSYFLWSSIPDELLLADAKKGLLQDPKNLEAHVTRMLLDKRAGSFYQDFGGQWLGFQKLRTSAADSNSLDLKGSMAKETALFVRTLVEENRSYLELADADFTFVNDKLAKLYGLPGEFGPEFKRVKLTDGRRGGILGQASFLTVTSYADRTSVVKRGQWVLEQMLCSEVPPPPPGIPALEQKNENSLSLREQMQRHRSKPECASCHSRMDPIGFSLENYDLLGAWRDLDGKVVIDPVGEFADGTKINGAQGLRSYLKSAPEFNRCVAKKLLTYAIGRCTVDSDEDEIAKIVKAAQAGGTRFQKLIVSVVLSRAFRNGGR